MPTAVSTIFLIGIVIEGLIYTGNSFWKLRKILSGFATIMNMFIVYFLILKGLNFVSFLLVLITIFRVINLIRLIEARMHEQYLRRVTAKTWLVLCSLQIIVLILLYFTNISNSNILLYLSIIQVVISFCLFVITIRNLYKTRYHSTNTHLPDSQLPTVTVAIPARDESPDLQECLISVLGSNYHKLEVLVLDDCSSDKTPEIIKSFAHDGVRFIKGETVSTNWLAKNQAYDKLTDSSSGDYILFCGADVRFTTSSIRKLVESLLSKEKYMMCVLTTDSTRGFLASLIQPLLYWWELALPRRTFNRPPVFSNCWIIRRSELIKLGGFESVHRMIVPEGYFARELIKNDKYSFIRSDSDLGITAQKTAKEQLEKAVRTRYPQIRRRPELAMTILLFELVLFIVPVLIFATGFWMGFGGAQILSAIGYLMLIATHVCIVQFSNPTKTLMSFINFPFVALTEIFIGCFSMFKYEFSSVNWKDRNICIPVMHGLSTTYKDQHVDIARQPASASSEHKS